MRDLPVWTPLLKPVSIGFVLATLSWGCDFNTQMTKFQYMPDMADSPALKGNLGYLDPPQGSIARDHVLMPENREEAESVMLNPLEGSVDLVQGKALWETYCGVCHGPDGKGQQKVHDSIAPPNIIDQYYRERQDGFYYHTITVGKGTMPGYGYAIFPEERWHIVAYLRELQKAGL